MSTHTPGPWVRDGVKIEGNSDGHRYDIAICRVHLHMQEYCEANARLIAAAPDMLAALRALVAAGRVPQLSSLPNTDTELSRAARMTYAAIAKATGDSERSGQ